LHRKQSSIKKLFELFRKDVFICPEKITYIFSENDTASPACYKIEFSEKLDQELVNAFSGRCKSDNAFIFCYPTVGFNRETTKLDTEKLLSLDDYLDLPILSIDQTLITRWQLISYLANKKGMEHFSDTREKFWQKQLDKVWHHKTTQKKEGNEESIRSLYEVAQRVVNENLNINNLGAIRNNISEIEAQVNPF